LSARVGRSYVVVDESSKAPRGPHFAVLLFRTRNELLSSYDDYGGSSGSSTITVPEVTYLAFETKADLEQWVVDSTAEGRSFFCFEVSQVGTVDVRVRLGMR